MVTLAGLLGWQGVLIWSCRHRQGRRRRRRSAISNSVVYKLVNGNMSPAAGWIVLVVLVGALRPRLHHRRRPAAGPGPAAPPLSIIVLNIVVTAAAGVGLVVVCNINRGALIPLRGVPWVVPFVLAITLAWVRPARADPHRTLHLRHRGQPRGGPAGRDQRGLDPHPGFRPGRTDGRLGRPRLRIAPRFHLDRRRRRHLVLYAVAAAVIGGTSLFGGRGKAIHPLIGGIVIGAVYNGLGLLGISTAGTDIAFALVLLAAVTIDSVVRNRGSGSIRWFGG